MEENNISQEIKVTMTELKKLIENSNSLNVSMANRKQSLTQSVEDALNEGKNSYNQNTGRLNGYSNEFEDQLRKNNSVDNDYVYNEMLKNHIEIENKIKAYIDQINEESKTIDDKLKSLNAELTAENAKVINQFHGENPYIDNTYMPDNQARIEELKSQISQLEGNKTQLDSFKQEFYNYFYVGNNEVANDIEIPNNTIAEITPDLHETQVPQDNVQKSHEDEIRALTDEEYSERRRAQAEHIINNLIGNNSKQEENSKESENVSSNETPTQEDEKVQPKSSQPAEEQVNDEKSNSDEINVPDFVDLHPNKLYTVSARDGMIVVNGNSVKIEKSIKEYKIEKSAKEYEIDGENGIKFDSLNRTINGNSETIMSKDTFEDLLKGTRDDYDDLDFNIINSLVNYFKGVDSNKDIDSLRHDLKNAIEDYQSTIRENSGKVYINYDLKSMKALKKSNREAYDEIVKHAHTAYTNKTNSVDVKAPWYTKLGWKISDMLSLGNKKALNPGKNEEKTTETEADEKTAEDPSKPAPSPMRENIQVSNEQLNEQHSTPANSKKQNQNQNDEREER